MKLCRLSTKFSLAIALLVTFSVGLMSVLAVTASRASLRERALTANLTAATLAARAVEQYVADAMSIMEEASGRPKLSAEIRSANWSEVTRVLSNFLRYFRQFDYVFVQDPAGVIRARVPHAETVGRDFSFRDFFRAAMRIRRPYLSGVYVSTAAARPVVAIAVPVVDEAGAVRGILVGALSLETMSRFVGTIGQGDGGHIYVVDATGVVVAHSTRSAVGSRAEAAAEPIVQAALAGRSGTTEFREPRSGEAALAAHVPIARLGWGVVAAQPVAAAHAAASRLAWWLAWIGFGCAAAAVLVGWGLAHTLTGSLHRLVEAAGQIAQGNFSVRVVQRGHDEVGGLAGAFNHMAGEVERSWERLAQKTAEVGIANESLVREITERRRVEEEVRRLNAELERRVEERTAALSVANEQLQQEIADRRRAEADADRANQAKSEFLSRMSHELRTPLNAILGFAQILEMEPLGEEQKDSVDQILKGGRHLLGLINEVLDISRIESGRLRLSLEPVPVAQTLQAAVDLVQPLAAEGGIQVSTQGPNGQQHVLADRQRLQQVLLNLLSNAVKYNRDGGTVRVTCAETPEHRLRITVADSGRGMTGEQMARLFTPFDRLGAEASGVEGTGLGLTLSKHLVEAMGGALHVESELGVGSAFALELPVAEAPVETLEPPQATVGSAGEARAAGLAVLYIEDNLSNLRLIERVLARRPGTKLLSAMQGRMGLELAREHRPDLILLDLHLPDLPGEEVLHRLLSDPRTRETPVVVLSADATPRQMERLLSAGARAYLAKPLDVRKLLAVLDERVPGEGG